MYEFNTRVFLLSGDFDMNDRYEWYRANRYTWAEKSVVSDEIIQYLSDFLNWLPSYNPETKESHKVKLLWVNRY
ncbi:hypothetical protein PAT3040_03059 [Paenibacillus agaridevorans]|uniref:Uncharacterized protein n=1 Tax=Paenibacillus agaridevorans TaxID=171404 RepID=A0A2R5EP48_9BACL|nr:hypothetical protein PAT3040_03059 [Paenibacillus agaridevorans]